MSKYVSHSSLKCYICGDIARGLNFDVITCMSCKAFFRRNALRKSNELQCLLNNDCVITQHTRGGCSACRLKKCFNLGMNPLLIRSSPRKSTTSPNQQKTKTIELEEIPLLSQPTTISLLNKDRSILTFEEWNLLSNIIHAYDEQNLITQTQNTLREQSCLPLKIRSKLSYTFDIINSYFKSIQPFLERIPYFNESSFDIRRLIIENNLYGTGSFNSSFIVLEAKALDNDFYTKACIEIYGEEFVRKGQRLITRMESNGTLIKIMLIILAFSTNSSLILPDHISNLSYTSTRNSLNLIRIQDIFIKILWKYLIYQYGFIEAIRRLDNLIKFYLDLLNQLNEINNRQHFDMINNLIGKTTTSLNLNN